MIIQPSTNLVTLHGRAIVKKIRKTLIKETSPLEGAATIYFNFHFKRFGILFWVQFVTIEFFPTILAQYVDEKLCYKTLCDIK